MNKIYKLIWNPGLGQMRAVSERATAKGKIASGRAGRLAAAVSLACAMGAPVSALAQSVCDNDWHGAWGTAAGTDAIACGGTANNQSIAIGGRSVATGLLSVAVGDGATATGNNGTAVGQSSQATGNTSSAFGDRSQATGIGASAFGTTAQASGILSVALGVSSEASGLRSAALGGASTAVGVRSLALGARSTANSDGSVALGADSVADTDAGETGYDPLTGIAATDASPTWVSTSGAVSLGGIDLNGDLQTRQITNLAAGTQDTDAVNVAQLKRVATDLQGVEDRAVKYDWTDTDGDGVIDPGEVDYTTATLAGPTTTDGGTTGGTTITNLHKGDVSQNSSDAINGSQLYGVSQSITNHLGGGSTVNTDGTINGPIYNVQGNTYNTVYDAFEAIDNTINNINNGGGIKYFHANSTDPDSIAIGANSVAVGPNAVSNGDNSVAIGDGAQANDANSVALGADSSTAPVVATTSGTIAGTTHTYAGGAPVGTVSVGAPGAERTITNVGAGRIDPTSTDAVNGSQLHATNVEVDRLDTRVNNLDVTVNNIGNRLTTVEGDIIDMKGDITNLDNRVTEVEGDITNLDRRLTVVEGVVVDVTNLKNGADGMFQVSQEGPLVKPTPTGTNSAAGGNGAVASGTNAFASGNQAKATGDNSTAVGTGATASANSSTALGQGATATHANSVALGSGSATTRGAQSNYNAAYVGNTSSTGEVNIGGRTITGVAAGVQDTDAVNVAQLRGGVNYAIDQSKAYTDQKIVSIQNDVWALDRGYRGAAASAMAAAALPQPYLPGKSMLSVGMGSYQGEAGMAIGLSGTTENGRWVYKASASGNTTRDWGFSVGAGIQW